MVYLMDFNAIFPSDFYINKIDFIGQLVHYYYLSIQIAVGIVLCK